MEHFKIPKAIIVEPRKETDYVRGLSTGITPIINRADGNWSYWLPTNEPQKYKFDTNGCTQFSCLHSVCTQLNWLKANGKMQEQTIKWFSDNGYLDDYGLFNLSERFTGALSGTTIRGNTLPAGWDAVRKFGILPQKDFNYSMAQSQKFDTQEDMIKDFYDKGQITQSMKDKAKKSLSFINIQYEWVSENVSHTEASDIEEALKQAPVQIGVPVCLPGWNNEEVAFCDTRNPDHAVELFDELGGSWYIFDHYNPYRKTLSKDYFIPQALLGVVTLIPQNPFNEPSYIPVPEDTPVSQIPKTNKDLLSTFLSCLKTWIGVIFSSKIKSNSTNMFSINGKDVLKGFVSAVITGVALPVLAALQTPGFDIFNTNWQAIGILAANGAVAGFVSYMVKNFFSDENGRFVGKIG